MDRQLLESFVVKGELVRRRRRISLEELNRVEDEKRFVALFTVQGLYLGEGLDDVVGKWRTIDCLSWCKLQGHNSGPVLVSVRFGDLQVPIAAIVLIIVFVFSGFALPAWVANEVSPNVCDPLHVKV